MTVVANGTRIPFFFLPDANDELGTPLLLAIDSIIYGFIPSALFG